MEDFFSNQACNFLFMKFLPDIADREKVFVEGRNKEKVLSDTKKVQMQTWYKIAIQNLLMIA